MPWQIRICTQGDTLDFWPALSLTFWEDGWSLELTWLRWALVYDRRR